MPDDPITAVIFDLGNVLIDFDHRVAARRISRCTDKTPEEIYNLFFNSELTNAFEAGKVTPQDFFLRVKQILALSITYEQFLPIWTEIFFLTPKNLAVYRLASVLKKTYRTGLLSNVNVLHLAYVKEHFRIFDAFHSVIASCDVGVAKPDERIYLKALAALGAQASRTFYTDDRPELIESAGRLGIHAVVFKDAPQLQRDLERAGIPVNAHAL